MQNFTFNTEDMHTYIMEHVLRSDMKQTLSALAFAKEKYDGLMRKNGEPYIAYPMTTACSALSCGLCNDEAIAALLLHNICEDCNISPNELPVNGAVKHGIELIRFDVIKGEANDIERNRYYDLLLQSREISLAKAIECCHNISIINKKFTQNKIRSYIDEVRRNVLPLLEKMKNTYTDDADILFAIKYHIVSIINSVEAALDACENEKWQFNSINNFHA